ncbi:hypothetical protein [Actinoplanes sp. NPDC026670]|uniref:FIMAH domain-containing protein n=1 Tax=Actinoplanes sp. NPDC026670 TaxID=3154700 RepID=UPI0033DDA878
MPEPHDLHQPTAQLPVVEPRGVYRAANHRRTALIVAGAAAAALILLVVWLFSGDDEPAPIPVAAPPSVEATASPEPEATEESAEPEPTVTTTTPSARPAQPGDLITGLAGLIDALEDEGELDDDAAEALTRRLEQAATRLSRGDVKEAARKIDEFLKKLRDVRKDEDVSRDAFNLLAAGAEQVQAVLRRA